MPAISSFYGILIQMHYNDHAPPHFHAAYAEYACQVNIRTLKIIHGEFPRRAFALVKTWAEQHRSELLENWELCRKHIPPRTIQPLR